MRPCVRACVYASVLPFALFYFTQREQCGGSCSRWTTVVLLIAVMGDQLNFFQGFQLVAFCATAQGATGGRRSVRVLASIVDRFNLFAGFLTGGLVCKSLGGFL